MTFSKHFRLRFICASTLVKLFLAPVSADNNWWSAWILYWYRSNIPCRIRQFNCSGIPFSQLQENCYTCCDVSAAKSFKTPGDVLHGQSPLSRLVCHFVNDPANSLFIQIVLLNWVFIECNKTFFISSVFSPSHTFAMYSLKKKEWK